MEYLNWQLATSSWQLAIVNCQLASDELVAYEYNAQNDFDSLSLDSLYND